MLAAFAAAALPSIALLRSSAAETPAPGRLLSLVGEPRSADSSVFAVGVVLICALRGRVPLEAGGHDRGACGACGRAGHLHADDRPLHAQARASGVSPLERCRRSSLDRRAPGLPHAIGRPRCHRRGCRVSDRLDRRAGVRCPTRGPSRRQADGVGGRSVGKARRCGERLRGGAVRGRRHLGSPSATRGRELGGALPPVVSGSARSARLDHRHPLAGARSDRSEPAHRRSAHHGRSAPAGRRVGRAKPGDCKPASPAPRRALQSADAIRRGELSSRGDGLQLRLDTRHGAHERRRLREVVAQHPGQPARGHVQAGGLDRSGQALGAASAASRLGLDGAEQR